LLLRLYLSGVEPPDGWAAIRKYGA